MPLVSTASIVGPARRDGLGVAAFNVVTLEHAEAIATAAELAGRPAILQISENAVKFHHRRLGPVAAAATAVARASSAPLAVHLDHIEDVELLHQAADHHISSVMFDGSKLDYQSNVSKTREAVIWAHGKGIWIEAELGEVGGKEGAHAPGIRTDPDEAVAFVAATAVDGLAVAVGSSHAMVDRTADLDIALIRELAQKLSVPLVLHGSSGVPDETLTAAVRAGMVKINVGTILNVAFTRTVRGYLAEHPSVVDPRKYLLPAREAISDQVVRILGALAAGPSEAKGRR
ncbi:MAG: class II fructose-bisphosphate aldolase [Mycobacterium sp.]